MPAAAAAVVKATDLVPKAFNGTAAVHEEKPDDLLYDLHHLAAVDSHPVSCVVVYVCGPAAASIKILSHLPSIPWSVYARHVCRRLGDEREL